MTKHLQATKKMIKKIGNAENGATAIEYALIAGATGLSLIATVPALRTNLGLTYASIAAFF